MIKVIDLPEMGEKPTTGCLTGAIYGHRDPDIAPWLPVLQHAVPAASLGIFKTAGGTLKQMFAAVLGAAPITAHLCTLQQIERLVEMQEGGEDGGLRTDGWGNFFPVETAEGGVSIINADRNDGRWDIFVIRLDSGLSWHGGRNIILGNPNAIALLQ